MIKLTEVEIINVEKEEIEGRTKMSPFKYWFYNSVSEEITMVFGTDIWENEVVMSKETFCKKMKIEDRKKDLVKLSDKLEFGFFKSKRIYKLHLLK